jgi:Family of unknown function (DUF716)
VAFIVEGLLLGFHLKGSPLEVCTAGQQQRRSCTTAVAPRLFAACAHPSCGSIHEHTSYSTSDSNASGRNCKRLWSPRTCCRVLLIVVTGYRLFLRSFTQCSCASQVLVHKILVITIAASAVVMLAEMRYKDNVLLTVARALLVGLQGIWFIQIGYIMFRRERCPSRAAKLRAHLTSTAEGVYPATD